MKFEEYVGKTVFVTGAASGIGQAQAIAFLENGANVFAVDVDEQGLLQLSGQYHERFAYRVGSVCIKEDVVRAFEEAVETFKQVDILLNTAGVLDGFAKTLDTDEVLWDKIMNTNVKGTYFVTNTILPHMVQRKSGVIVNKADFEGDGEIAKWVAKETPAGRWAQPSEVASLTLYLASQAADYMHGAIIPIDGGWITK